VTTLPPAPGLTDLRAFLALLEREREIVTIDAEVDPDLEAAEIHRRVIAEGGPALRFQRIRGAGFPLVTNLFGTRRRVELAFGRRPLDLVERLAALPHTLLPPTLGALWRERGLLGALLKTGRHRLRRGPVTEVVEREPRLLRLPALRTWSEDGGPFFTLPLVHTEHPHGLGSNLGIYRVQRFGDDRLGLHLQIGKGGAFHLAAYETAQRPMPVNLHLGGPPALVLAAIAPLPENVPELLLASLLLGRRLRTCSNPAGPLPVIADCECVIVGHVPPGARHPEGPFGDHYGYYSLRHDYPLVRVDALLRRPDPILTATVVGKPRQEDFYLGNFVQELLLPLVKVAMPQVQDLWAYGETGFHSLAAAVVPERYAREALSAAFRILGEGQLALTKFLLVLDQPRDLRDFRAVLEHVLARADFPRDLHVFDHVAMDTLDYTGPAVNRGSKGVLLGLGAPRRELPREPRGPLPNGFGRAVVFCAGCLVVGGPAYAVEPQAALRLAQAPVLAGWPLVVLVDDAEAAARSPADFLWTTFTRFEPAGDLHARSQSVARCHVGLEPPIVVDARKKPGLPAELFVDDATAALVTRRWREYFPVRP
jgi:UbiD family decarboxylase